MNILESLELLLWVFIFLALAAIGPTALLMWQMARRWLYVKKAERLPPVDFGQRALVAKGRIALRLVSAQSAATPAPWRAIFRPRPKVLWERAASRKCVPLPKTRRNRVRPPRLHIEPARQTRIRGPLPLGDCSEWQMLYER
jgi:hypothetical protein